MLKDIREVLIEKCQITPNDQILVGVSGGPDSLCLLNVLHQLGYQPIVAHLDHQLRTESSQEAEFVGRTAAGMGLTYVSQALDVKSFSQERGLSLEEGARLARYQFLFYEASKAGAVAVLVGHNADDQVETVILHLLQGAGLTGLSGMAFRSLPNSWSENIALVRPLLGTWRAKILEYLDQQGLVPRLDTSNQDIRILRNRLRHELIPLLENYNPRIRQVLCRMADILHQDNQFLMEQVNNAWETIFQGGSPEVIALDFHSLRQQPPGIQRRVIQKALLLMLPVSREVSFQVIDRAVAFLNGCLVNDEIELMSGLRLVREADRLWLAEEQARLPETQWPGIHAKEIIHLPVPGQYQFPERWLISAEVLDCQTATRVSALENQDPMQAWLDFNLLDCPLVIRATQPGDRFQPLGMLEGSIKVSDFMINVKLPKRARRKWPLVLSGNSIAWLPGYRVAQPFRLTDQTTRTAHLWLEPEK